MRLIGRSLKIIRLSKDLSIKDIAQQTGFTEKAIEQYETGYSVPDIPILYKFSQCYQVPLEDLIPKDKIKSKLLTYDIWCFIFIIFYLLIMSISHFDSISLVFPLAISNLLVTFQEIHSVAKKVNIKDPIFALIEKYTNNTFAKSLIWFFVSIFVLIFIIDIVKYILIRPIITIIIVLVYLAFFISLYFKRFKNKA